MAKWDSKKEYTKFWSQGAKGKRKPLVWWMLLGILLCAAVVSGETDLVETLLFGQEGPTLYATIGDSYSIVDSAPDTIPDYAGQSVIELTGNVPGFSEYDLTNITGESYSELDYLGRCGTAVAMLGQSTMPTEERGSIGSVKPTGWNQNKYPGLVASEPPYLYNRCHLIAFALSGENANEKNLITGTRYMNATSMLPYEELVMGYLDDNPSNHVLYRVSPYFKDDELLARGVEMEAYSVEDNGEGICFHVFVYNVQPGVELDYLTGENWIAEGE